ncbi:AAA family ATPase [Mycobacterium sp.]|uniref:AAA family ATPase n=1 Tax=Mycobacterium sp. TaxID=1785 RepID=UPI003BABEA89
MTIYTSDETRPGKAMAKAYIRQLGIPTTQLLYVDLKGQGRLADMRSEAMRRKWALKLREHAIDVLVIDPVSPITSAAGLDENAVMGVRQLLDSFDALALSAGCTAGPIVVHHSGWIETGRARGASAFGDWPGLELNLKREEPTEPFSTRLFSIQSNRATGGAVHGPRQLGYDPATRKTWYEDRPKPVDPKRAAYDEFIGSAHSDVTSASVVEAVGIAKSTAIQWLDNDHRLHVVSEASGRQPKVWRRRSTLLTDCDSRTTAFVYGPVPL